MTAGEDEKCQEPRYLVLVNRRNGLLICFTWMAKKAGPFWLDFYKILLEGDKSCSFEGKSHKETAFSPDTVLKDDKLLQEKGPNISCSWKHRNESPTIQLRWLEVGSFIIFADLLYVDLSQHCYCCYKKSLSLAASIHLTDLQCVTCFSQRKQINQGF